MNGEKFNGIPDFVLEREHKAAKFYHNLTGIFSLTNNNI